MCVFIHPSVRPSVLTWSSVTQADGLPWGAGVRVQLPHGNVNDDKDSNEKKKKNTQRDTKCPSHNIMSLRVDGNSSEDDGSCGDWGEISRERIDGFIFLRLL